MRIRTFDTSDFLQFVRLGKLNQMKYLVSLSRCGKIKLQIDFGYMNKAAEIAIENDNLDIITVMDKPSPGYWDPSGSQ